jgi:hypothetical protein
LGFGTRRNAMRKRFVVVITVIAVAITLDIHTPQHSARPFLLLSTCLSVSQLLGYLVPTAKSRWLRGPTDLLTQRTQSLRVQLDNISTKACL